MELARNSIQEENVSQIQLHTRHLANLFQAPQSVKSPANEEVLSKNTGSKPKCSKEENFGFSDAEDEKQIPDKSADEKISHPPCFHHVTKGASSCDLCKDHMIRRYVLESGIIFTKCHELLEQEDFDIDKYMEIYQECRRHTCVDLKSKNNKHNSIREDHQYRSLMLESLVFQTEAYACIGDTRKCMEAAANFMNFVESESSHDLNTCYQMARVYLCQARIGLLLSTANCDGSDLELEKEETTCDESDPFGFDEGIQSVDGKLSAKLEFDVRNVTKSMGKLMISPVSDGNRVKVAKSLKFESDSENSDIPSDVNQTNLTGISQEVEGLGTVKKKSNQLNSKRGRSARLESETAAQDMGHVSGKNVRIAKELEEKVSQSSKKIPAARKQRLKTPAKVKKFEYDAVAELVESQMETVCIKVEAEHADVYDLATHLDVENDNVSKGKSKAGRGRKTASTSRGRGRGRGRGKTAASEGKELLSKNEKENIDVTCNLEVVQKGEQIGVKDTAGDIEMEKVKFVPKTPRSVCRKKSALEYLLDSSEDEEILKSVPRRGRGRGRGTTTKKSTRKKEVDKTDNGCVENRRAKKKITFEIPNDSVFENGIHGNKSDVKQPIKEEDSKLEKKAFVSKIPRGGRRTTGRRTAAAKGAKGMCTFVSLLHNVL